MYAIRSYYEAYSGFDAFIEMTGISSSLYFDFDGIDIPYPLILSFASVITSYSIHYTKLYDNGAVFNLIDNGYRNTEMTTLATRLKNAGYETVYATDEKRFSNIDESFGFDSILGPPMGAADFLLGTINDFPFSNLIVNTRLGRILFPYS